MWISRPLMKTPVLPLEASARRAPPSGRPGRILIDVGAALDAPEARDPIVPVAARRHVDAVIEDLLNRQRLAVDDDPRLLRES
jgi:hypothetical protein